MKHSGWITAFFIGLGLGISVPLLAPNFLMPHLPQALQGDTETIEGLVTRKQKENKQLLLTVSALEGATLVTFQKKAKEIDMLVELHDTITLSMRKYEPFLFDPNVMQVKKPQGAQLPKVKSALRIEGISIPEASEKPGISTNKGTEVVDPNEPINGKH